jgi:histidine triad (HIT) family protein
LCIPKQEVDNLFDLDTKLYNELMMFSKKVAKALKKAIPCERVAMSVIGLEVPHAHVHLIPINEMKDVTFRNKVIFSKNEFQDIANNIKSYL